MRGTQLEDRMRGWLTGGYEAAVGTVDDAPAFYALWRPDGANRIHLRQFFVVRDQRRLGLGRRAIAVLRAEYWPPGAQVSLDVLVHNQRAIEFWRTIGFRDYSLTLKDR